MNDIRTTNEADLLSRSRQGDQTAYGELVKRHYRLVSTVALRLGVPADLAQDVAQEVFLRAWRRLPGFRPQGENSFRAWLCRISHNLAVDTLRHSRPQAHLDDEPILAGRDGGWDGNPAAAYLRDEEGAEIRALIAQLPPACRIVLVLREYEGFSYGEIAHALDIPLGTVMSRLNYARTALRKALAERTWAAALPSLAGQPLP
jgi:RNA polymerase sigma-70 factor, ECF subfamily